MTTNFFLKNKRVLIISGIIAAAGIGIWLLARGTDKKEDVKIDEGDLTKENNPVSTETTSPSLPSSNDNFPLLKGSKGVNVQLLQAYLNIIKNSGLVLDGIFGVKTDTALSNSYGIKGVTASNWNAFLANLRSVKGIKATTITEANSKAISYLKQYIINQGTTLLK
jgi:peptidoglycan hydrolase-like protein with peptidoglycan-binding domain